MTTTLDVSKWTNTLLLKVMHTMEQDRLQMSGADVLVIPVTVPYPHGYREIVAEAQRRKLCL